MPHMPRRLASTIGIAPELLQRPTEKHAPIPVQESQSNDTPRKTLKVGMSTLSPWSYKPDQKRLHKTMFGKEVEIDPNTRQLVLGHPPAPAATLRAT